MYQADRDLCLTIETGGHEETDSAEGSLINTLRPYPDTIIGVSMDLLIIEGGIQLELPDLITAEAFNLLGEAVVDTGNVHCHIRLAAHQINIADKDILDYTTLSATWSGFLNDNIPGAADLRSFEFKLPTAI